MTCDRATQLIHLNREDELTREEREALRAHLATCERCSSEMLLVHRTEGFLVALKRSEPVLEEAEDLVSSVLNRTLHQSHNAGGRKRRQALDVLLDAFLRPVIRYGYVTVAGIVIGLFLVQGSETLQRMETLSERFARSEGPVRPDIRYSIALVDAEKIVGLKELENMLSATPVRLFDDHLSVRKSDLEPWAASFSSRLAEKMLAASETPVERLPYLFLDVQRSLSTSLTLSAGGNNQ